MTIAVASGKGGTGKTTVAVGLALSRPEPAHLLDCDVEEPNAHLFLKPDIRSERPVTLPLPVADPTRCDGCGACARACRFNAIAVVKGAVLVFPELCHGCGGCVLACPRGALTDRPTRIGSVRIGARGSLSFAQGQLDIGRPLGVPLIRVVRELAPRDGLVIIDAPPGTTCPVVASCRGADYVILVTEPTPFGLNDLNLAVALVRSLNIPFGVLVNRSDIGDTAVRDMCRRMEIPVLLEIPEDAAIARAYSRGIPAVEAVPRLRGELNRMCDRVIADHSRRLAGVAP